MKELENLINELNPFGYYQKRLCFIMSLGFLFAATITTLPVIIASKPTAICTSEGYKNESIQCSMLNVRNYYCSPNINASDWTFQSTNRTVVIDWHLYCQEEWKIGFISTIYFLGYFIGNAIFGILCDTIGRKPGFYLSCLLITICSGISSIVNSYFLFLIFHCLAGIGVGGIGISSFILITESVGMKYRSLVGISLSACFSIGLMLLSLLGYWISHWRVLTLTTAFSFLIFIFLNSMILESPHWLATYQKETKLNQVLNRIADINQRKRISKLPSLISKPSKSFPGNIGMILKHSSLRKRLLIMLIEWFAVAFAYYGLSFNVGNLGNNLYISLFLSGVSELPFFLPSIPLTNTWGRRKSLALMLWISTFSYIICSILHVSNECEKISQSCPTKALRLISSLIGKGAIASAFSIVYIYTTELFPTNVRSVVMGLCSQSSRLGSMLAPLILPLADISRNLPFVFFGCTSIIGATLSYFLIETMDVPLFDTDSEICNFNQRSEEIALIDSENMIYDEKSLEER